MFSGRKQGNGTFSCAKRTLVHIIHRVVHRLFQGLSTLSTGLSTVVPPVFHRTYEQLWGNPGVIHMAGLEFSRPSYPDRPLPHFLPPQRGGNTHISHESVPKSRFMTASPSREKPLAVTYTLFHITQARWTQEKASPLGEKLSAPGSSEPGAD